MVSFWTHADTCKSCSTIKLMFIFEILKFIELLVSVSYTPHSKQKKEKKALTDFAEWRLMLYTSM